MSDYNGWKNYATWRVNLEIFDGMTAQDVTGRALPTVSEVAEGAREWAEEAIYATSTNGLARDYALAFLSDVDWYEIADHLIGAMQDADEAEEA